MIDTGAGLCIAFHRRLSTSKRTKECVLRALDAGIPTYLVDSEEAILVRIRADDARLE
jgi:hypothetical protein